MESDMFENVQNIIWKLAINMATFLNILEMLWGSQGFVRNYKKCCIIA